MLLIGILILCSWFIWVACASFEPAADYLGRNMPPGVKGATINAIGSSLPELITASFLLFVHADQGGFAAGVATCAGSAVFNAVVIPALCVMAVSMFGVIQSDGSIKKVSHVVFRTETLVRETLAYAVAEAGLILLLVAAYQGHDKTGYFPRWSGYVLVGIYASYLGFMYWQMRGRPADEYQPRSFEDTPLIRKLALLDFNGLLFGSRAFNAARAWTVAALSALVMGIACYFLAEVIIDMAAALDVPAYFTALILAAAASSIPDAILSVKDARRGNFDDAISNAIGSNTFDIGIGLGLPVLIYYWLYDEPLLPIEPIAMQQLPTILILVTALVVALLFVGKRIGKKRATVFLFTYAGFVVYVMGSARDLWEMPSIFGL